MNLLKVELPIEFRAEKLYSLIRKILTQRIATQELNLFIAYCQALAKTCLIHEMQRGRLNIDQSLSSQDQLEDFALDTIADLFARNKGGDYYLLRRVFEPKLEQLNQSPASTTIELRKLISSRVHQSLVSLYSQVDRDGWKIWRNLSLVTTRSAQIHDFTSLNNHYLYSDKQDKPLSIPGDLNPNGESLPDSLLSEWLQYHLKKRYGLPQVLLGVFTDLSAWPEYQQFIERSRLFHMLQQHMNISYADIEDIETLSPISSNQVEDEFAEITQPAIAQITSFITEKLQGKYLGKGKISMALFDQYRSILTLYFTDLISDGHVERLQKYLSLTNTESLHQHDWLIHRGRLEYMIKLGKLWLRDKIYADDFSTGPTMWLSK